MDFLTLPQVHSLQKKKLNQRLIITILVFYDNFLLSKCHLNQQKLKKISHKARNVKYF